MIGRRRRTGDPGPGSTAATGQPGSSWAGRSRAPALMLTLTLALGLAGCATVPAPGTGSLATGPQDTSRTLRIMGADFPYTDATVAEFRRRHPDITVSYVKGGVSFEDGSAQNMLRSGTGADLLLVNSGPGRVGQLAQAGLISPLDTSVVAAASRPDVLEQIQAEDGTVHEVVEGLDVFQVNYDRELFERVGVDVPQDWASFLDTCRELQRAGEKPMLLGARDNFAGGWLLGALVQSAAGREQVGSALSGSGSFTDEDVVEGGRMLVELVEQGCLDGPEAAALDDSQAQAGFWRGEAAMIVVPQGSVIEAAADGVDTSGFDTFPMPPRQRGGEQVPTAGLALSWVASNTTRSSSAVRAWVEWITSPEYLELTAEQGRTLVPAQEVPEEVALEPAVRDGLDKVAAGAGYNPSVYLTDSGKEAWYAAVQGLLTGSSTPQEAMAAVEEER